MENGGYIFTRCSIQCLRVQRNTVQIASILKMLFTLNSSTVFKICGCITCIWTLSVLSVMSYILLSSSNYIFRKGRLHQAYRYFNSYPGM